MIGPYQIILAIIFVLTLYTILKVFQKSKKNKTNLLNESITSTEIKNINIPETCPHCKNPNTKGIRICEWCGNQII